MDLAPLVISRIWGLYKHTQNLVALWASLKFGEPVKPLGIRGTPDIHRIGRPCLIPEQITFVNCLHPLKVGQKEIFEKQLRKHGFKVHSTQRT